MAVTHVKNLPPQARKRIEKLETTVSELKGTLARVIKEMERQRLAISVREGLPTERKTFGRRPSSKAALQTPVKVVPHAAAGAAELAGLSAAVARGEAAKVQWVRTGEVVPAKVLAEKWGITPQALGPAAERGEVFAVLVKRQRYFPREFLDLSRDDVGAVSKSLSGLSSEEKLVFWKRPHGALGGKTVFQLLSGRKDTVQLEKVERLARSWARQAQFSDGAPAA